MFTPSTLRGGSQPLVTEPGHGLQASLTQASSGLYWELRLFLPNLLPSYSFIEVHQHKGLRLSLSPLTLTGISSNRFIAHLIPSECVLLGDPAAT